MFWCREISAGTSGCAAQAASNAAPMVWPSRGLVLAPLT